jgi:GT2 family glycosyltransferase
MNRPTPARNRNIGAGAARGEWIFFTDSDCVPDAMWAASLLAAAAREKVDVVCGSVMVGPDVGYWGLCDHLLVFAETTTDSSARDVAQAATLNFGIRKSLITALGGFDEAFPAAAGEDQDFSLRLIAAGHRIFFSPTAIVEHHHTRHQFADAWRHIYGYGEAVTVRRNLRGMDRRWRFALRLLHFPGLLELAGLGRVLLRLWFHFRHLVLLRPPILHALPGVLVLDFALSYGMICSLRNREVSPIATSKP